MTTFYNHRNQNNTSDTPNSQQINYKFNENLDININTNEDYNLYNKIHNRQQNISVPLDNNTNNTNNTINDTNIAGYWLFIGMNPFYAPPTNSYQGNHSGSESSNGSGGNIKIKNFSYTTW